MKFLLILLFLQPFAILLDGYNMGEDFCYWDARSKADAIVIIINQCIVTTIFLTAALRLPGLYALRKHLPINVGRIGAIHGLVLLWGAGQSVVNFYSLGNYLSMAHEMTAEEMLGYSHGYALAAAFPGFLVQTLFITICFTFCQNTVSGCDIRKFPSYSLKFVAVLKGYFLLRLGIRLAIVLLIAACSEEETELYSTIEFISLIVDSAIVNIFLLVSLRVFLARLDSPRLASLRREFFVMFCCSVCRIVIDSLYLILNPHHDTVGGQSWCVSEINYKVGYTIVYNIMGNYLMHFFPLAVILKVYRFDHREAQEKDELISKSDNTDSFSSN